MFKSKLQSTFMMLEILLLGLFLKEAVAKSFVTTPSSPTYAERGGTASLNWTYSYHTQASFKKWYQSTEANAPIGKSIMFQSGSNQPAVRKAEFTGRVEYFENGGLLIKNVSLQDEGYIRFEVNFADGEALYNKIILNVTIRPQLTSSLQNETVTTEGSNSTMHCTFQARPRPDIKWLKNGQQILDSNRFVITSHVLGVVKNTTSVKSTLTVVNANLDDNAVFKCSADIPFGTLSSQTYHRVLYMPRNTTLQSNKPNNIGYLGGSITLTCQASALPVAFYQIYKDGILLSNTTNSALTLNNLGISQEGNYTCIPINTLGSGEADSLYLTVYVPPLLESYSGNIKTIMANTSVNISCTFYGKPTPVVSWHKNNTVVQSNAVALSTILKSNSSFTVVRSILFFESVKRSDHGVYTCIAQNAAGKNNQSITLNVKYQPIIKANLSNNHTLIEDRNKNVSWHCSAEGNPVASVSWTLNGINIKETDGFEVVDIVVSNSSTGVILTSKLIMIGITRDKSGILQCNASSSAGVTIITTKVVINYLPLVSLTPEAVNMTVNAATTLSCVVISQPLASLRWQKDGKAVNDSNYEIKNSYMPGLFSSHATSNLSIVAAKKSDFGIFECIGLNEIGNTSKNTEVEIFFPPEYTEQLSPKMHLSEGTTNYTFVCTVRSNPVAAISWLFNGTVIKSNSDYAVSESQNITRTYTEITSKLAIDRLSKEHFGNYTCEAKNDVGTTTSMQQVIIQYMPFIIQASQGVLIVNESQPIDLFCEFQSNPKAAAYWKGHSASLDMKIQNSSYLLTLHSSAQYFTTRAKLYMAKATPSDSGFYTCGANNSLGVSERNITVIVKYKPTFMSVSQTPTVLAISKNITLHCTVKSNPSATISWHYKDNLVSSSGRSVIKNTVQSQDQFHSVTTSTIYLSDVNMNHTGNYTCKATNEIETVQQEFVIVVQYAPRITSTFGFVENVTESSKPYFLECLADANPMPVIEWLRETVTLTSNITTTIIKSNDAGSFLRSRLEFKDGVKRKDHGVYQCNASNIIGSDMKSVIINVWYGPDFLSNSTGQTKRLKSQNVSFECIVEGHPPPMVEWYKGDKKLSPVPVSTVVSSKTRTVLQSKLRISDVTKNDTAEYECKATNKAGSKSQTFSLNVQYKPTVLVAASNITANISQEVQISCKTDANPPVVRYNWTKNGILLSESASTLSIQSVQESSSGVYSCTPINELGSGESVTFILHVQVPATITLRPTCKQIDAKKLNCTCNGYGIPTPIIYWTKNERDDVIANGTSFSLAIEQGNDGRYHCHVQNTLAKATATYGVFIYGKPVGDWTTWSSCNETCGMGYQLRTRVCNIRPCTESLEERKECNGTCVGKRINNIPSAKKDTWAIVLYVLIPVLAVLCIVLFVWLANTRGCRREDKEFIVPLNNNLSQPPSVRSMPTRRDIYLPDGNFGVINSGYRPEEEIFPITDQNVQSQPQQYDTIEVEMQFGNEDSSTDPSIDNGDDTNIVQTDHTGNGVKNGQANLSFYNTAYTHL